MNYVTKQDIREMMGNRSQEELGGIMKMCDLVSTPVVASANRGGDGFWDAVEKKPVSSGLTVGLSEDAEEQALSLAGQYLEGGVSRFDAVNALMMDAGVSRGQAEDIVEYAYSDVSSAGDSELLPAGDRAIMSAVASIISGIEIIGEALKDRYQGTVVFSRQSAFGWVDSNNLVVKLEVTYTLHNRPDLPRKPIVFTIENGVGVWVI